MAANETPIRSTHKRSLPDVTFEHVYGSRDMIFGVARERFHSFSGLDIC
jgi:hypothetical protein